MNTFSVLLEIIVNAENEEEAQIQAEIKCPLATLYAGDGQVVCMGNAPPIEPTIIPEEAYYQDSISEWD